MRSRSSVIRPPSATVSPLCTATVLLIWRWLMVGVVCSDDGLPSLLDDVADLLLDLEDHQAVGVDPRRHGQDHAGVAQLDRVDDRRVGVADAGRLLGGDRHLVADLEPRGLVVEHQQLGRGDHVDVGDLLERVEDHADVARC